VEWTERRWLPFPPPLAQAHQHLRTLFRPFGTCASALGGGFDQFWLFAENPGKNHVNFPLQFDFVGKCGQRKAAKYEKVEICMRVFCCLFSISFQFLFILLNYHFSGLFFLLNFLLFIIICNQAVCFIF
jgi:hypothetical protein